MKPFFLGVLHFDDYENEMNETNDDEIDDEDDDNYLITAPPTKRKRFLFLSVRFGISIQTLLSLEWQILYQIRILVHRNIIQLHFFKA